MTDLSTLLAELDAAVEKMTPGPWTNSEDGYIETGPRTNTYQLLPETEDGPAWDDEAIADATGIVALVNAYPALREAIEQLQQDLSKVPLPRKSPDNVEAWAQKLAEDTGNADD